MTKILSYPRYSLSTFGQSAIDYFFLASLDVKKTKTREGRVIFQKPKIILSQDIKDSFEGYGSEVEDFIDEIYQDIRTEIRIIGYHFKHEPTQTKIVSDSFSNVLRRIKERTSEDNYIAILSGIDSSNELSILKLTLEMMLRSASSNITEFEERGFFDPPEERQLTKIKIEIENLFRQAEKDPRKIRILGRCLKDSKLFSAYEDRFFNLVTRSKR
ncbi:MAG: hypothetical protein ABII27_07260 [bacterium]